jgi:hypothetical protein
MDIPESPRAVVVNSTGISNADSWEEAPVAEIQGDITSPGVPDQRSIPQTEVQQTTHPETTRFRKGVRT